MNRELASYQLDGVDDPGFRQRPSSGWSAICRSNGTAVVALIAALIRRPR